MKRLIAIAACVLAMATAAFGAECVAERVGYRGWEAIHMGNGLVDLWIVPDIGGRVIQLEARGHEYFFVNDALAGKVVAQVDENGEPVPWPNYGGDKLWPAPQGADDGEHWPGPGDPVLDGGKFGAEILSPGGDEARVRLTSPVDKGRTGVQFIREFSLRPNEARVFSRTTMRNGIDRPVRWSVWEVTQLDARSPEPPGFNGDLVCYVPASDDSRHEKGFYVMFGDPENPAWRESARSGLIEGHFNYYVGKLGCDSDAGWLTAIDGRSGMAFAQVFEHFGDATYPDDGSSVEFWINGRGEFTFVGEDITLEDDLEVTFPLMEAEVLSPLVSLEPGEEYSFDMLWGVGSARGKPYVATDLSLVARPAAARLLGGVVSVEATVTPFVGGRLSCALVDNEGRRVALRELGLVVPGSRKQMRLAMRAPEATEAQIILTTEPGAEGHVLATLPVVR